MPIPDFQSAMLPLLRLAGDGGEHRFRDAVEKLAAHFELTDEQRNELLPSGTAPLFDNRVGWARTYLKQAGLLDSPKRGFFRLSARGAGLLVENGSGSISGRLKFALGVSEGNLGMVYFARLR